MCLLPGFKKSSVILQSKNTILQFIEKSPYCAIQDWARPIFNFLFRAFLNWTELACGSKAAFRVTRKKSEMVTALLHSLPIAMGLYQTCHLA
jgi:hypothetical protein